MWCEWRWDKERAGRGSREGGGVKGEGMRGCRRGQGRARGQGRGESGGRGRCEGKEGVGRVRAGEGRVMWVVGQARAAGQ